jgi:hypothetical protein
MSYAYIRAAFQGCCFWCRCFGIMFAPAGEGSSPFPEGEMGSPASFRRTSDVSPVWRPLFRLWWSHSLESLVLDPRHVNPHVWRACEVWRFEDSFTVCSEGGYMYMFSFDLQVGYHHIDINSVIYIFVCAELLYRRIYNNNNIYNNLFYRWRYNICKCSNNLFSYCFREVDAMCASRPFSLLCDESNDRGNDKNLVILLRVFDDQRGRHNKVSGSAKMWVYLT